MSLVFQYFELRDACREKLTKHLSRAFNSINGIDNPDILDLGCGTGVPALHLAGLTKGNIYAIDTDELAIAWLKEKAKRKGFHDRLHVVAGSVFDLDLQGIKFDIVLAEGLLNVIGFRQGLELAERFIKEKGRFIIHDEQKDSEEKKDLMKNSGYTIADHFLLNDKEWWDSYYSCLEKTILSVGDENLRKIFNNDLLEIESFRKYPERFRSAYYVLKKG